MEVSFGLTHIAFVLSLAFFGGLLLQRLRQPALIGYIIVGAIIGPGILGIQVQDATLSAITELAIIFLMFMLGLELDISRFLRGMRTAIWVTILQILSALAVMLTVALIFDWPLALGILLGFTVAMSSTAVAVSMLRDLHESNSSAGRLATAILIAQDIAVVPMLLIVGAFGDGTFTLDGLIWLAFSLGIIACSMFVIYYISQRSAWVAQLERLLAAGANQQVVAGMALCFAGAALSGSLGLSTAYGAFAVGLLISNVGSVGASYRHAIHPIHDFLMMLFFLSIGLLLDFTFITENIFTILALLAIIIFLKTAFNVYLLRLLGTPPRTAYTLGAVLGQIGEFSFVLIALGLSNGFISTDGYRLALSVIALSLALSPLWFQLVQSYLGPHAKEPRVY
ncbi:MAG: cation:proton antiporter [Parcubacteria group bacterium]|nr:cation:proton antiporter [Parcubacteria group bacterium]